MLRSAARGSQIARRTWQRRSVAVSGELQHLLEQQCSRSPLSTTLLNTSGSKEYEGLKHVDHIQKPWMVQDSLLVKNAVYTGELTGQANVACDRSANYTDTTNDRMFVYVNDVPIPVPAVNVSDLLTADARNTLSVLARAIHESSTVSHHQRFAAAGGNMQQQYRQFSTKPKLSTDTDDIDNKSSVPEPGRRQQHVPPTTIGTTKVPTPPSSPPAPTNPLDTLRQTTTKSIIRKGTDLAVSVMYRILNILYQLPGKTWYYITHPKERSERIKALQELAREEANHYWMGTKLLWADIQTSRNLMKKTLQGTALTRRERKQLLRTVSDLFRLVPFSMFVLIPFMEFALPFALRIFPNLLPSTYQDSLKAEENMKRELQSRIAMAQFFQETLEQLAKEQKQKAASRKQELKEAGVGPEVEGVDTIDKQENSAASLLQFLEKARSGEMIPPEVIIRYANYFHDDLTLDNMPRMQLVNMCKYMSIPPYGTDAFLRFQLRHKIRILKEDDQRILWEGIDSLTKMELREACQERGMRSTGLSKDAYKRSLQQWLDLSVNKNVPISLLIMSRTFFLRDEIFEKKPEDESKSLAGLVDAISGLDRDVVNEVILEVATSQEQSSNPNIKKIKLEVLSQQNELIRQEEEAAKEAAAKRKENYEKRQEDNAVLDGSGDKLGQNEKTASSDDTSEQITAKDTEESKTEDEDRGLSTREMDAISQLLAQDPVIKERAELEKIKAAMKKESDVDHDNESTAKKEYEKLSDDLNQLEKSTTQSVEKFGSDKEFNSTRLNEFDSPNSAEGLSSDDTTKQQSSGTTTSGIDDSDDDPIVARLKKRLETMVDKIEVQLSDVQVKIGDKLHYLDKDRDGILSREEMALCLQQVLKRKISFEEAMEIADEIDHNHDGVFTADELIRWIDKHKLVRFVEEGRDEELNQILQSQSSNEPKDETTTPESKK